MALEPGRELDRYVVDSVLGQGGMAVVYKVKHMQLGSWHALKLLTMSSESIKQRLLQEGRVQATLAHPNIVAVTDILDVDGAPGLVMEFITGSSLDIWLEKNKIDIEEGERLFRGILSGVMHAHSLGVVHRDLKPANVMLYVGGGQVIPKVADFGLAKAFAEEGGGGMGQTRSGVAMGTPAYMAPEQIRDAKNVDERADVFSLGCILYELVVGRPPFTGPDILSIFNAVASGEYAPADTLVPGMPAHLQNAIEGCLQVDRGRRLANCEAVFKVLDGAAWQMVAPATPAMGQTWSGEELSPEHLDSIAMSQVPAEARTGEQPMVGTLKPDSQGAVDATLKPPSRPGTDSIGHSSIVTAKRGGLAVLGLGGMLTIAGVTLVGTALVGFGGWTYAENSATQQMRTFLDKRTDGEITFKDLSWGPRGVTLSGVRVAGSDGEPFATIARVRLDGSVGGGEWQLTRVAVHGMQVDLRRDGDGWALPPNTTALVTGNIKPRDKGFVIRTDHLFVSEGTFTHRAADGDLTLKWDELKLAGFVVSARDPAGWSAAGGGVKGLVLKDADPWMKADRISVADGVGTVEGGEVWVRTTPDGRLDLPEAMHWGTADWLGGTREGPSEADWLGFDLSGLPLVPDRLEANGGLLHVLDVANTTSEKTWEVSLSSLVVGPLAGDEVHYELAGTAEDGAVALSGELRRDGLLRGTGSVKGLEIDRLAAYLEASSKGYGVSIEGGSVDAEVAYSLMGTSFAGSVEGTVREPRLALLPGSKTSPRTNRLLKERDEETFARSSDGEMDDATYAPVNRMAHSVADAVFAPAGGAVWPTDKRKGR